MSEWDLVTSLINAANNCDQNSVSEIILNSNFDDLPQAQSAALHSFEITPDNVLLHKEAAKLLKDWNPHEHWSFSDSYRYSILAELLADIS